MFFDLQFANQVFSGFLESLQSNAEHPDNLLYIDVNKKRMDVLVNCNKKSINAVQSYKEPNDAEEFKFTVMQNVLESVLSENWSMNFSDFEHVDEKIIWKII